jgi:TonB family protein
MRPFLLAGFAAAALAFAAAPAQAAPPQSFADWLAGEIDRNLDYPASLRRSGASGTAVVRFSGGGDGRPAVVELVESSGRQALDRAALRTVAALRLPANAPAGPHIAVLHYGRPDEQASARN